MREVSFRDGSSRYLWGLSTHSLGLRVQRQQGRMVDMQSVDAYCNNRNSVEAMATMLKNCNLGRSNIGKLSVDNIGYHGWAILGKVFSAAPGCMLDIYANCQ